MKYQGFYDYSLDNSGKPDRTFTAQQFCMYMKALLGNGIVITDATGDNAWKLEKTGDLTAKVILGNNGYNFASLNGNPFIVDEEINFTFSQGTDRWDAVLIRANATMEVRATDVIIQEGDISYTRNTDVYDLRIARIHVVDNIITEIIDDRFNIDYCGIANGLVTVPTDELEQLIASITSGSAVALKDGTLQTNLNAEKLGGFTSEGLKNYIINENFITGTYSGDNTSNRIVELGFMPRAVIIHSTDTGYLWYGGCAISGAGKNVSIAENGFKISRNRTDSANNPNESGAIYFYIAFK